MSSLYSDSLAERFDYRHSFEIYESSWDPLRLRVHLSALTLPESSSAERMLKLSLFSTSTCLSLSILLIFSSIEVFM
jgi:hypothetical protein